MKNVFEELDKAMSQSATAETNATAYIAVEQSDNRIAYGYAVYIGDKCLSTGAKLLPSVTTWHGELLAAVAALEAIDEGISVRVVTPSDRIEKWLVTNGAPKQFRDTWRRFTELAKKRDVIFQCVTGWNGDDRLAQCRQITMVALSEGEVKGK